MEEDSAVIKDSVINKSNITIINVGNPNSSNEPASPEEIKLKLKIYNCLKTLMSDEFERFCITYYPDVKRKFAPGMNRPQLENILIDSCMIRKELPGLYDSLSEYST